MLLKRMVDADPVSASEAAATPLFRVKAKTGKTYRSVTVAQLRKHVRDCAAAIGYPKRNQWGAHSGRIGGATDLASTGKASELLLKAKGRWASDIGENLRAHDATQPAGGVEAHARGSRARPGRDPPRFYSGSIILALGQCVTHRYANAEMMWFSSTSRLERGDGGGTTMVQFMSGGEFVRRKGTQANA